MSDEQTTVETQVTTKEQDSKPAEHTFTQGEVDKMIRERLERERKKYADYDDLKAKASDAKTLEERLAEVEKANKDATARALRSDVAARYGISPEDRDLFLTATDEETLEAQAKRLSERDSERKKRSNVVPNEGNTPSTSTSEERQMVRSLFGAGA